MESKYSNEAILKLLRKIDIGYQPTLEERRALSERVDLDLERKNITSLPKSLGRLFNLQNLNLSGTPITTLPESMGMLSNLQRLDLSSSRISFLPESVGRLEKLRSLDLRGTPIASLPESIRLLGNLQELLLGASIITDLPESIGQLANLQVLLLWRTPITILPEPICRLPNLQFLSLSGTKITTLPTSIGQLVNLQCLDISNTPIASLPASVGQLVNLQSLDISYTQITTLPEALGHLANLHSLYLGSTGITVLPESISQISMLQSLDISCTKITDMPKSVGQLVNLQSLDISYTQITNLPETLWRLVNLQSLNIGSTGITTLPESIGQLSKLQSLDISCTKITDMPKSVGQLTKLERILLNKTHISSLPEALSLGPLPILDELPSAEDSLGIYAGYSWLPAYYFQGKKILAEYFGKGEKQGFREAKIIFLGDGNAGKTFTVKRFLAEGMPESPEMPYSLGQTHGVCPYDYHHNKEGEDFLVHLWDFGGQEMLHAMHRCFLTENTVYVLMVSTRDSEHTRRLRYWLQSIRPFTRGAELLVIVNVFDGEGQADIDEIGLQNEFKRDLRLRFETLSVKDCTQEEFQVRIMKPLLQKAEAAEAAAGLHPANFMRVRDRVKRALANSKDTEGKDQGWINAAKYLKCCRAEGIQEAQTQATLLRYFTDLGVCFSTIGPEDYSVPTDCRLIRPIWLTNALYAIIEECKPVKGWLTLEMMEACLGSNSGDGCSEKNARVAPKLRYDSTDCDYVLRVAESSALAYRDPYEPGDIFIPATCRYADKKPEELQRPEHPAYSLIYEWECSYLPETAVQRLMLEFMRKGFHRPVCWRGGFRFENEDCCGILETVEDDRVLRLVLWSEGKTPVYEQLEWFRKQLARASVQRDEAKEYISTGQERYLLQRLINAKHNRIKRVASALDQIQTYAVSDLLGSISDETWRENPTRSGDTYISNFYGNGNAVCQGPGSEASVHYHAPARETELRWARFAANFPDTEKVFELLCMDLFALDYYEKGAIFPAVPNNPGVECHPKTAQKGAFAGKRLGFQSKYFAGSPNYAAIKESVETTIKYYHTGREAKDQLEVFVLYSNQKPSESDESGKVKGNQTFQTAKDLLQEAGIRLEIMAEQALLNHIGEYPELVKRYFYV